MPYPFAVTVGRIPVSSDMTNRALAIEIWYLISKDLYGHVVYTGQISAIRKKLGECKQFYWSVSCSVSDGPVEDGYKIEVCDKEIVVDLL